MEANEPNVDALPATIGSGFKAGEFQPAGFPGGKYDEAKTPPVLVEGERPIRLKGAPKPVEGIEVFPKLHELHAGQMFRFPNGTAVFIVLDTMEWNVSPPDTGHVLCVCLQPPAGRNEPRPGVVRQLNALREVQVIPNPADAPTVEDNVKAVYAGAWCFEDRWTITQKDPVSGTKTRVHGYRILDGNAGNNPIPPGHWYVSPEAAWLATLAHIKAGRLLGDPWSVAESVNRPPV